MGSAEPLRFSRDGRIDGDVPCGACGHNLRSLLPDARCPECGTPVVWSLRGSFLAARDPAWVNRLRASAKLLTWLLPWIWLPLSWPFVWLAYWGLTTRDPAAPHPFNGIGFLLRLLLGLVFWAAAPLFFAAYLTPVGNAWVALGLPVGAGIPILTVVITLALVWPLLAAAVMLLPRENAPRFLVSHSRGAFAIGIASVSLGLVALLDAARAAPPPALYVPLGILAAFLQVPTIILAASLLPRVWKQLEIAEVLARTGRNAVRAWPRRRTPDARGTEDVKTSDRAHA